jgi:hypothetical protein
VGRRLHTTSLIPLQESRELVVSLKRYSAFQLEGLIFRSYNSPNRPSGRIKEVGLSISLIPPRRGDNISSDAKKLGSAEDYLRQPYGMTTEGLESVRRVLGPESVEDEGLSKDPSS